MHSSNLIFALGLTVFAGLSTGIGSAIAFFAKRTNTWLLTASLGFSAGVMIYISFVEMFPAANYSLVAELGKSGGDLATVGAFFSGIVIIAIIDRLVPAFENPHQARKVEDITVNSRLKDQKLYRMGMLSALAIGIHNFPEGIATLIAGLKDINIGIAIAIAVAIHNIPEGIAVSVPIFYATGSKKKAFLYSFFSGLAEPIGAILGYLLLLPFLNNIMFGLLFAFVAGIMVFISLDELLPAAREYGYTHLGIYSLIGGMAIMAISLILLT